MVVYYKRWKKYNEIQLTKNKMDLNNQKIKNNGPLPKCNKDNMIHDFGNKFHSLKLSCRMMRTLYNFF